MNRLLGWLAEEGGIKHFVKQFLHCRKGHDWRDGGDWFICARCDKLSKLPEIERLT